MGNSGSQNTVPETHQNDQWAHSFPRTCNTQTKLYTQHKVLPEKTPQLKLRSTNNGEILQSGGTISGRHAKLAEDERIKRYLDAYNERKLQENYRKTPCQGVQHKLSNSKLSSQEMKLCASEPDLRYAVNKDEIREKKPKKKYRAPSPPKRNIHEYRQSKDDTFLNPQLPIRKARLFKTRAETKKHSSQLNDTYDDVDNSLESTNANVKPNIKRLSLPEVSLIDLNEFTRELKDATQRFKINENSTCTNLEDESKNIRGEASGKESSTPEISPTLQPKYQTNKETNKPKPVFYFGMNENNIFSNNNELENSTVSDISSDIDSEENESCRSGIDLQLRPILPKKQLEIPRFSPAAAWRLLSLDTGNDKATHTITSSGSGSGEGVTGGTNFCDTLLTDDVPLFMEDHIEKYSRPLPPLLNAGQRSSNDKSGDSGISGDDGGPIVFNYDDDIIEEENITRIRENKDSIRQRTSWTPQQDLDDSSAEEDVNTKSLKQSMRTHKGPHVFSLSLPRENHLATYIIDRAHVSNYNGIQKFKKSLSGVWGNLSHRKDYFQKQQDNNWFLSKSAPNSLTQAIHSLERHKTIENQQNINAASRLMYLPEIDFGFRDHSNKSFGSHRSKRSLQSKSCENITMEVNKRSPEQLQDPKPKDANWNTKKKPKKYTFQSTIRQIEKKRLSDKLSKEAEKRERERLRELNAMQKVEEEFQRKRAREKANIRQQLRLFSLDEDTGCHSLPNFYSNTKGRPEPDGAFSTGSSSSLSSSGSRKEPYLNQHNYKMSPSLQNKLQTPSTKELSEFRQTQRDYKDYNSNLLKYGSDRRYVNKQTTIHPQVSYTMTQIKGLSKQTHNYRKEFASGIVSIDSSHSDTSQNNRKKQINHSSLYTNCYIPF